MSARNYVPAMVKWMVEEGTKNTSSGNWIFTSAEIAEAFPVAESSVIEMFGAILSDGSATFDLTFYTDYCPNISDETKAG